MSRRLSRHEQLEPRQLMAVDFFAQAKAGAVANGWVTIIADGGDSAYIQRASTKDNALLIANNSSFLNLQSVPNIDTYADVFVTNASRVNVTDQTTDGYPQLPFPVSSGVTNNHTYFVVPVAASDVDFTNPITGIISDGQGGRWSFSSTILPNGAVQFNNFVSLGGGTPGLAPVSANVLARGPFDFSNSTFVFDVTWSASVGFSAASPPMLEQMTFDRDSTPQLYAPETWTNMPAASAAASTFSLSAGAGNAYGEIVAGTLSGVIEIDQGNGAGLVRIEFTTQTQNPLATALPGTVPLVFRTLDASGLPVNGSNFALTSFFRTARGTIDNRRISGSVNLQTGVISVTTEGANGYFGQQEVGKVSLESASFARYSQPDEGGDFALWAGQDFVPSLTVDLLAPGATASIESPIVNAPFVELRASNVVVDARMSVKTSLTIGKSEFGLPVSVATGQSASFSVVNTRGVTTAGQKILSFTNLPASVVRGLLPDTQLLISDSTGDNPLTRRVASVRTSGTSTFVTLNAPIDSTMTAGIVYYVTDETGNGHVAETDAEQAIFNAAVAAKGFDIRLTDDVQTSAVKRSRLFVSATGSLAGALPVTGAQVDTPFDSLFAQVEYGDVLVEGTVNGTLQSYILQSPEEGQDGVDHRGPYYFSTQSLVSGGNTGLVRGGTVAITLGNDVPSVYSNPLDGGSSAENIVTLNTQVINLRVKASDQFGNALKTPFPYTLKVQETDDLVVDAVASSSMPIAVGAVGKVDFRATLSSASDVSVTAGTDLLLNAPLSTAFGSIALTGRTLAVSNSVRVLDTFSDDRRTDIVLTATAGSMLLSGPISAVNTISLSQTDSSPVSSGGKIYGNARVIADTLSFVTTGSVTLGTDVRSIKGQAARDVSFTEVNSVLVDITAFGNVSLVANGLDVDMTDDGGVRHVDANGDESPVALWGSVREAVSLVASAPQGSIDLTSPTSGGVVLGNRASLAAGTATGMQAAGPVTIRSLGGSVDVLDAPVAGMSAYAMRAASVTSIGTSPKYSPNTPGTFPGTLENGVNGALSVDGVTMRQGDTVLLTNQSDAVQNGAYFVVNAGGSATKWRLARIPAFDTTAELAVNVRFRVVEGTANAGRLFAVAGYENGLGSTPISVASVPNRTGAFPVVAVSTRALDGTFVGSASPNEISGTGLNALPASAFDGVTLQQNDYVLVRFGVGTTLPAADLRANGVYQVTNVGGGSQQWKLTRVASDVFDVALGGLVVVDKGSLRTRVTGNAFQVGFNGLGQVGVAIGDVTTATTTNIGSDNFNAVVTYVVSTNGGTNSAAGSLGKMLLLKQQNVAVDPLDATKLQQSAFKFGNSVGEIVLTQQLPQIVNSMTIDASSRYAVGAGSSGQVGIDGSRITLLRTGLAPTATAKIHGLEFVGSGVNGSKVTGLQLYGFRRGAAIRLDGTGTSVSGVVVDSVKLGTDLQGRRAANDVGIQVAGNVGGYTTISRNQVLASNTAGVQISGGTDTDGVRLVGNQIGRAGFENKVGVDVAAGPSRTNRIGLESAAGALARVSATRPATMPSPLPALTVRQFVLPSGFTGWASLYIGMGVSSSQITVDNPATAPAASIAAIDVDNRIITITGGTIGASVRTLTVDFGAYAAFTVGSKLIQLPVGVTDIGNLFIGQGVTSVGLPRNTVVTAIDPVGNTITLSNVASQTMTAAIVFSVPARNQVTANITGMTLASGATQVVATDVTGSVLDGIVVSGGTPRIGAVGTSIGSPSNTNTRTTAKDITANSNAIYGNGGWGINVTKAVTTPSDVTIQGNVFGADVARVVAKVNTIGNIQFQPNSGTVGKTITLPPARFTRTTQGSGTNQVALITVNTAVSGANGFGPYGLPTGYKVYVASSSVSSGLAPAGAYTITRVNDTTFTFTAPVDAFTATSGTLTFQKYGPVVSLPLSDGRDFEGNAYGLPTGNGSNGGTDSNGGILPPRPTPQPGR